MEVAMVGVAGVSVGMAKETAVGIGEEVQTTTGVMETR